jgi:DNA-binding SARP family transcriptional activator
MLTWYVAAGGTVELGLLGPFEVRREGSPIVLGGPKQRALLARLALQPNQVVSSERLVDELWGGNAPETASTALQVYVSQLRKALEPDGPPYRVLETRSPGYVLRLEPESRDVDRFEALLTAGRAAGSPAERAELLRSALALWRGEPLADLAYEPFVQAQAGPLEELRLCAFEERIDAELELGRHAELVGELEAHAVEHPLREPLRVKLMLALYRSGRQADALEVARDTRRLLSDELGLEPSPALQELERQILRHDPALVSSGRPGGRRSAGAFVGHDEQFGLLLAGLDDALAGRGRLFLIEGAAGSGKTRLADEIASQGKRRGARVLWGRSWEAGDAPPYWPWVQALRGRGPNAPAALDTIVGTPAGTGAFDLFDATVSFVAGLTCTGPLVIVLDDLHVADEGSLLLLEFVAAELALLPVLLLGLHRDCTGLDRIARFATARISL